MDVPDAMHKKAPNIAMLFSWPLDHRDSWWRELVAKPGSSRRLEWFDIPAMNALAALLGQSEAIVALHAKVERLIPQHAASSRFPHLLIQPSRFV